MYSYFSYTECEAPGPFDLTPGYKIKSAVSLESSLESELEAMNRAIAAFPSYSPPKIDIFTSKEEFAELPKNWSYSPIGEGHLAFYRLFTSGMARGRAGNPFHQVVTVNFEKAMQIESSVSSENENSRFVPADLYFWDSWISPRGDDEVENSNTAELGVPKPQFSEPELIERFESLLGEDKYIQQLRAFESSYLEQESGYLSAESDDLFFTMLASISRLFPRINCWALPFSNQQESLNFAAPGNDVKPIYKSESASGNGSVWSDCIELAAENGLIGSVFEATKELDSMIAVSFGSKRNLQHLPLALLLCGHEVISFDDRFSVENMADYLDLTNSAMRFASAAAKEKATEILDSSFNQSLLNDKQADVIYGVISSLSSAD